MTVDYVTRTSRHSKLMLLPMYVALAVGGSWAFADEIRIEARRCSPEVHLVVREAHLSTVLNQLAQTLHFELHYQSAIDPLVSLDTRRQLDDLLALLVPSKSVSLSQTRIRAVPAKQRIVEARVLPKPQESKPGSTRDTAQALPAESKSDQTRLAQEGIDLVLRAHGVDPEQQAAVGLGATPERQSRRIASVRHASSICRAQDDAQLQRDAIAT